MSKPITAGLLADMTNFIKTISDALFKAIDKLEHLGVTVAKSEKTEGGGVMLQLKFNGELATLEATPTEGKKGYVDVVVTPKKGAKITIPKVQERHLYDEVVKALNEAYGIDIAEAVNSSHKMQVTLQRVNAATSADIKLMAINCNYSAVEVSKDLDTILSDESFLDQLTDEPVSLEITDADDAFDVTTISNINVDYAQSIDDILSQLVEARNNAQLLHWGAAGVNFEDLHSCTNDFVVQCTEMIDYFGELSMELAGTVHNLGTHTSTRALQLTDGWESAGGFALLSKEIDTIVCVLELYYANFPTDVQSDLDGYIRACKKTRDYFIRSRTKTAAPY